RIPEVRQLDLLGVVLAAVGRDDAVLAVSAAGVAAEINEGDVVRRLVNAARRPLAWDAERLTGHDRVIPVGPHVEFLNLVPVLRLIRGTTRVTEARGRVELEVVRLVDRTTTALQLSGSAAPPSAAHVVAD